jgi:Calcium/calmodulin dependent protein kinase II association domain
MASYARKGAIASPKRAIWRFAPRLSPCLGSDVGLRARPVSGAESGWRLSVTFVILETVMASELERSAIEFTRQWCALFVGDKPDIRRAMDEFTDTASILIPNVPYRLTRRDDEEEIHFSHVVDGRGQVHFWQVLEPHVVMAGGAAVVSYYARFNVGRAGESVIRCAKESLVLVRAGTSWKIAHLHNSPVS